MANLIPFLKRSAASGTASTPSLYRRYQENPFFRSTVNVLAIQGALVLIILIVFSVAVRHQQHATVDAIEARRAAIRAGQSLTSESLDYSLQDIRNETLGTSFGALILLALVFGYLASRYALAPTRNSLEYQKRFIGNIAHELRTPLSIIRTNMEVALMDKTLHEHARQTFAMTVEELDRISETINNLLSFNSLMRANRIKREPLQLGNVLEEVVNRHQELASTNGIALSLESPEMLYVVGNEVALGQVFTNLVKNALNYTPNHDNRSVTVKAYEDDEKVSVSVIDTGIGIAEKDLYHVFEPFFRGDTSRSRGVGGGTSGLGLAIVNDIVRAHSGSIVIRSALNRGTTIEISFPKADTREHVQGIAAAEDDGELHEAEVVRS